MKIKRTLVLMLITIAFAACKKDNADNFDPGRYYIVVAIDEPPAAELIKVFTFGAGNSCSVFTPDDGPGANECTYSYKDRRLNIIARSQSGASDTIASFDISGGKITNADIKGLSLHQYATTLCPVPASDAFDKRSFDGTQYYRTNDGQVHIYTAPEHVVVKYESGKRYDRSIDNPNFSTGYKYTLINNGVAITGGSVLDVITNDEMLSKYIIAGGGGVWGEYSKY